jgi:hypothetical protein
VGWADTGQAALFMLRDDKLQELSYFKQPLTSWFVGDRVVQGASSAPDCLPLRARWVTLRAR